MKVFLHPKNIYYYPFILASSLHKLFLIKIFKIYFLYVNIISQEILILQYAILNSNATYFASIVQPYMTLNALSLKNWFPSIAKAPETCNSPLIHWRVTNIIFLKNKKCASNIKRIDLKVKCWVNTQSCNFTICACIIKSNFVCDHGFRSHATALRTQLFLLVFLLSVHLFIMYMNYCSVMYLR